MELDLALMTAHSYSRLKHCRDSRPSASITDSGPVLTGLDWVHEEVAPHRQVAVPPTHSVSQLDEEKAGDVKLGEDVEECSNQDLGTLTV